MKGKKEVSDEKATDGKWRKLWPKLRNICFIRHVFIFFYHFLSSPFFDLGLENREKKREREENKNNV